MYDPLIQNDLVSALDPASAVLMAIALVGLVPVLIHGRAESRLFVVAYGCLAVAAFATNLENLFLGTVLNYAEHFVGLGGSGLVVFLAAYRRYRRVTDGRRDGTEPAASAADDGPEVAVDG
jgi:asparagine N-glycosylation enzyme membrane subunit Stt3